jgi:putative addiction module killer protein
MFELVQSHAFEDWIAKLRDRQAKRLIAVRLSRMAIGNFGDAKPLGEGVAELRIHYGPGYRVYYQMRGNQIILLLCGGDKGSQAADIGRARTIAKSWED